MAVSAWRDAYKKEAMKRFRDIAGQSGGKMKEQYSAVFICDRD